MKPNCYKCKFRATVLGSAHSTCRHPANKSILDDPLIQLLGMFASVGRVDPIVADTGINVKGNPTGVRRGWFNWPLDFDPAWLESCDGFSEAESE